MPKEPKVTLSEYQRLKGLKFDDKEIALKLGITLHNLKYVYFKKWGIETKRESKVVVPAKGRAISAPPVSQPAAKSESPPDTPSVEPKATQQTPPPRLALEPQAQPDPQSVEQKRAQVEPAALIPSTEPTRGGPVNHPSHYNASDIECIDAIRAALTPEEFRGFIKGNVIKYCWRSNHKAGDQDLEKAHWYLGDYLKGQQP